MSQAIQNFRSSPLAPESLEDYTEPFLKQMDAAVLDNWCLSQGIGFKYTLHTLHTSTNPEERRYVSFVFHQQGLVVAFIDWSSLTLAQEGLFSPEVIQFVSNNTDMVEAMLQMQRNFKFAGMPNQPLHLNVPLSMQLQQKRDLHSQLSRQERKLKTDATAVLRIFLSRDTPVGTSNKKRNFEAFMYPETGNATAHFELHDDYTSYLVLETKDINDFSNHVYHRYESKDLINCIQDKSALPQSVLKANTVNPEFLTAIRKVFQAEQDIEAQKPPFEMYDLSPMEI